MLGHLDSHMKKNEVGPSPHSIYKNLLEVDQKPKCKRKKPKNYNTFKGKHRGKFSSLGFGNGSLDITESISNKRKNSELHQN